MSSIETPWDTSQQTTAVSVTIDPFQVLNVSTKSKLYVTAVGLNIAMIHPNEQCISILKNCKIHAFYSLSTDNKIQLNPPLEMNPGDLLTLSTVSQIPFTAHYNSATGEMGYFLTVEKQQNHTNTIQSTSSCFYDRCAECPADNPMLCTKCKAPFVLNQNQMCVWPYDHTPGNCTDSNCLECVQDQPNHCMKCKPGMILGNGKCM